MVKSKSSNQNLLKRMQRELPILLGFVVAWIVLTWPLLVSIVEPSLGYGDFHTTTWGLWWTKIQAFSLSNPWSTDQVFAPQESLLAYHALLPLPNLILAPFASITNEVAALKWSLVVVSPLTAYITYRLSLRCGLTRFPATITGIIYALSPMLLQRLYGGHFILVYGALMLPLALIFAMRFSSDHKNSDALLYGATLGIAVLIEPRSALFAFLLTVPYLATRLVLEKDRSLQIWVKGLCFAVLAALIISSPQLWMMYKQQTVENYSPNQIWLAQSYVAYSNDLSTVFAPTTNLLNRLGLDNAQTKLGQNAGGEGFVQNFGIGAWLLIIIGFAWFRRRFVVLFFGIVMVVSIVLSFGPHLRIAGEIYTPLANNTNGVLISPLLPFTWITSLPVLNEMRLSSLFMFLALLPAAILAGFGVQALLRIKINKVVRIGILTVILGLVLLEAGTFVHFRQDRPMEIKEIYEPIKRDKSDSIVVDVPLLWIDSTRSIGRVSESAREPMYRATQHGHPIASGNLSRLSEEKWAALLQNRFYTDLIVLDEDDGKTLPSPNFSTKVNKRLALANAKELGVGWVVVWPETGKKVVKYIRSLGYKKVAEKDGMRLYRAPFNVSSS